MTVTSCVFCQIADGSSPTSLVYRDGQIIAFQDIHPAAPIHILVAPIKHIDSLNDLQSEDEPLLLRLMLVARQVAITAGLGADGYRLVINNGAKAGQSVFHLHVHVLGGRPMHWPPG